MAVLLYFYFTLFIPLSDSFFTILFFGLPCAIFNHKAFCSLQYQFKSQAFVTNTDILKHIH